MDNTIIDNEDRKQERRIEVSLIVWSKTSLIEKAQRPARIEGQSDPKKAMVDPGFEPGPLGQNAIALPLALPPRPWFLGNLL